MAWPCRGPTTTRRRCRSWRHVHQPFDAALRDELLALNQPGADELQRGARAANAPGARLRERRARRCCEQSRPPRAQVRAIGAHGQTVRHRPDAPAAATRSSCSTAPCWPKLTGIDVVCDLRSRDVAAGGQGAPLVPAFHADRFGAPARPGRCSTSAASPTSRCCTPTAESIGFDCGPANALLDAWCRAPPRRGLSTKAARWAAQRHGRSRPAATALLAEPYFASPAAQEHRPRPVPRWLARRRTAHALGRRVAAGRRAGHAGRADGTRRGAMH